MLTKLKNALMLVTALAMLAACAPAPTPTATLPPPSATLPPSLPQRTPTAAPAATQALPPTPSGESLFPKVTADDWQLGPANARITILEYGDYQ